ncbi:aminotransferase class V-fold PLP-dependent enzyme [Parasphingorhabdus pacifica]
MQGNVHPFKAIIIGAGPVACLVALQLRARSIPVDVYEKSVDIRRLPFNKSHSFNLTLTRRGLGSLAPKLTEALYGMGVPLPQRVIHQADGTLSYQQYGTAPDHHLLSIPRDSLHRTLLTEAENAGTRFFFGHQCVGADPNTARATFAVEGNGITEAAGDVLIGCDGANSIVRHEMSRRGARMRITQEYIEHGYVELRTPPGTDGQHALLGALRDPEQPASQLHGLHVWPRGDFMALAQPNVDNSYTTSLFMPLTGSEGQPSFRSLRTPGDVDALFERHFADLAKYVPDASTDVLATPPASLKTVKCFPYHHERAVLIGDSAHTMVPFYGQGINCSFEDVETFAAILDRHLKAIGPTEAIRQTLIDFTAARKDPGDAIADLSLSNLRELTSQTGKNTYHTRSHLEQKLHERHPDLFIPLYHMVAFTDIPYQDVVRIREQQEKVLDELCERFDAGTEADRIIEAYAARATENPCVPDNAAELTALSSSLELTPDESRTFVNTVVARILKYQEDLAAGRYPASYLHGAENARDYSEGRRVAVRLREPRPPLLGTDLDTLLKEVFDTVMTNGMIHPHPGFLSHVPSGGLFQAAVGEFLARTLNRFAGVWAAAPGFTQIETNVIRWFCGMLGYGEGSFGYLTTGGSIANFMGLRCALEQQDEVSRRSATVYVSSQGHFSVAKAARMAGVETDRVRVVDAHPDHTIDVENLRERIEQDRRLGLSPACVVGTAGTTNTGAIDDLVRLGDLCRQEGIWYHVDACFGGFFRLTERGRALLSGIEQGDSIAVDAHKSLFLPHGTSALLVKDQANLRGAFEVPGAGYIPELTSDDDHVDFCDYGPELTREVRGLTAWLPIKLHGVLAFEQSLDEKLDLAADLAERLRRLDGIEVVERGSRHLPVVAFKLRAESGAEEELLNERLCELICARGNVYLATARLPREGLVIRACVLHHQTDKATIDQLLDDVAWSISNVRQEALSNADHD